MPLELPLAWVITLNVLGWPVIQLGLAWAGGLLPESWLNPASRLFRPRSWEAGGHRRWFGVTRWKHLLPDGSRLVPTLFPKHSLASRDAAYLRCFLVETCRGEAVHWAAMFCAPVFFLWNPWWADLIMAGYAIIANLPCIIAQRHNRARLARVLHRRSPATRHRPPP